MYRFVPMIFAEEISLPKDRRCLRFKCDSFYELNAVNTLPVHDLSAVNDCILRFKYRSTHVKSTVDQLVDWRMEKKQHMRWTQHGAQMLLHARCALLNGELGKYTLWSASESSQGW